MIMNACDTLYLSQISSSTEGNEIGRKSMKSKKMGIFSKPRGNLHRTRKKKTEYDRMRREE
jgi:hypothetical protein